MIEIITVVGVMFFCLIGLMAAWMGCNNRDRY